MDVLYLVPHGHHLSGQSRDRQCCRASGTYVVSAAYVASGLDPHIVQACPVDAPYHHGELAPRCFPTLFARPDSRACVAPMARSSQESLRRGRYVRTYSQLALPMRTLRRMWWSNALPRIGPTCLMPTHSSSRQVLGRKMLALLYIGTSAERNAPWYVSFLPPRLHPSDHPHPTASMLVRRA